MILGDQSSMRYFSFCILSPPHLTVIDFVCHQHYYLYYCEKAGIVVVYTDLIQSVFLVVIEHPVENLILNQAILDLHLFLLSAMQSYHQTVWEMVLVEVSASLRAR